MLSLGVIDLVTVAITVRILKGCKILLHWCQKWDLSVLQELNEEEASWLDYSQDEEAVKRSLVDDVFQVLLDDCIKSMSLAYELHKFKKVIEPIEEVQSLHLSTNLLLKNP